MKAIFNVQENKAIKVNIASAEFLEKFTTPEHILNTILQGISLSDLSAEEVGVATIVWCTIMPNLICPKIVYVIYNNTVCKALVVSKADGHQIEVFIEINNHFRKVFIENNDAVYTTEQEAWLDLFDMQMKLKQEEASVGELFNGMIAALSDMNDTTTLKEVEVVIRKHCFGF